MKFILNKWTYLIILSIFLSLFLTNKASASFGDNVFGWGWSENVGWISFNSCVNPTNKTTCGTINYGVNIEHSNDDKVSGYAWSENVGWISFNPTDWGACPPNNGGCNLNTFLNSWGDPGNGWARALNGKSSNSGGWDGWISLEYAKIDWKDDISSNIYGQTFPAGVFHFETGNEYIWGSEVIGWVDLSYIANNPIQLGEGGVFITSDIPSVKLIPKDIVQNSNGKYKFIAGNKIDFDLEFKNFNPTSCSRNGTNTFNDWNNLTDTDETDVDDLYFVKYDSSNGVTFNIECNENGSNYLGDSVEIETVLPEIVLTDGYSCFPLNSGNPSLMWTTNSTSVQSCSLDANHGNPYPIENIDSSPIEDTYFKNMDTYYQLNCTVGDSSYQTFDVNSNVNLITVCQPDYEITTSKCMAGGKEINGAAFKYNGKSYVGTAFLKITPKFGFNSDVKLTEATSSGVTLTPDTFDNGEGTIKAELKLDPIEYEALKLAIPGPLGSLFDIPLTSSATGYTDKTFDFGFCDSDGLSIKPKYKPF